MNKKQYIIKRIIVVFLSVFICAFIVLLIRNKTNKESSPIDTFPSITAKLYKGGVYSVPIKYTEGKTVVVFFSPECEICETELSDILRNNVSSKNRWLFITHSFLKDELDYFLERIPIDTLQNSVLLLEDTPKYHSLFNVVGPPSLFVYNKEGKLIHSSYGGVLTSTLVEWLQ